jgi:hypothetical protein
MQEAAQSYIYGLFDPADQVVRYVGQTTRPNARLCMHKSANPNPNNGSMAKEWIAGMLQEDRLPCMIILEICDFSVAHQREAEWYKYLCAAGYPILNNTSKFNRPNTSRTAKPYKRDLTHKVFSIIEVDLLYISHDPASPESQQKFGTILEAMKQLGNGNLSAGIRKAIEMTTQPYYINEQMLGNGAKEASARLMVDLLREHGHDVEYGEPMRRNPEPPFNDAEWQECLDLIGKM